MTLLEVLHKGILFQGVSGKPTNRTVLEKLPGWDGMNLESQSDYAPFTCMTPSV